jgi:hypothetical protein
MAKYGYDVLNGNRLIDYELALSKITGHEIDFTTKTTILGTLNFR